MEIKIGCDPEFFVKKDGVFVSAYGLIPGTKFKPMMVDNGGMQVDGMALEFNTTPASTADEFAFNINSVLSQFREIIPNEYEFVFEPVAEFTPEYMLTQPKEATELGCTPDYNAWTGQVNPKPSAEVPFRTASGHIHIGWTEGVDPYDPEHFEACCMLVKQLDCTLGRIDKFWDGDTKRRSLYGALGAFRPKSYGVEYRVLSNAWLRDPELIKLVFNIVTWATDQLKNGKKYFSDEGYIETTDLFNDYYFLTKVIGKKVAFHLNLKTMFDKKYEELLAQRYSHNSKSASLAQLASEKYEPFDWGNSFLVHDSAALVPSIVLPPKTKSKPQPFYTTLNKLKVN